MNQDAREEITLFPNPQELADLVLAEMKLPTSSEQAGARFKASLRGHYAFCLGDVKATKAADFEASLYDKINPLRDFKILYAKESDKVKQTLASITQKHDDILRELQKEFPLLSKVMWQVFRRTGFVDSFHAHYALNSNLEELKQKKAAAHKYGIVDASDEEFSNGYLRSNRIHLPWEIREMLKLPKNYRLVEFDKEFMLGIGRYAFANEEGDIFQTIWDMRHDRMQFFNYPRQNKPLKTITS